MTDRCIVITGGAGFVGSHLAIRLKAADPSCRVIALDSLKRRGSELNLPRLQDAGVEFRHGDVRCLEDLWLGSFDLLIDCSAEASVQAGQAGSPRGVLENNLIGTINCLEAARVRGAAFLFLSTSRVFPIASLNGHAFHETASRFEWLSPAEPYPGFTEHGVAEDYPLLAAARSFYGASKLACESLIQEYVHTYDMRALTNRCGLLAGPWQMARSDQGVVALWVARHVYQQPLRYIGFGGEGRQVRDVLHIDDLADLILKQLARDDVWDGRIYNVGGGRDVSVSLRELTDLCREVTGHTVDVTSQPETSPVDLRIYLTDARRVRTDFDWQPSRSARQVVDDIHNWIVEYADLLRPVLM